MGIAATDENLAQLVDTKIGARAPGNTVVGPQLPQGSINPSPDGPNQSTAGHYAGGSIWGFSQTHVSGTGGVGFYGNILISPMWGELALDREKHTFRAQAEKGSAGHYEVKLDRKDGKTLSVEIAPTHNAAIYSFQFPEGEKAFLKWDLAYTIPRFAVGSSANKDARINEAHAEISENGRRISGWAEYVGGWSHSTPYRIYFMAEFDLPPLESGTWTNSSASPGQRSLTLAKDEAGGVFFEFPAGSKLLAKIAISFKSQENAAAFLAKEIPDWDFDNVRSTAETRWNKALSAMTVKDPQISSGELRKFYTALYHANVMPRDRTSDAPWETADPYFDDHYAIWDTFRTLFPLYHLLYPEMAGRISMSFPARFEKNGEVMDSFVAGHDGYQQGGDNVGVILADAYAKKVPGVDWERAFKFLKFQADKQRPAGFLDGDRGWIPNGTPIPKGPMKKMMWGSGDSVSKSVEYSYNDFCVSLLAKGLRKDPDAKRFLERSRQWAQLWNNDLVVDGFQGFLNPRSADGAWLAFDPQKYSRGEYFYEGTTWVYSMYVPHEMAALVEKCGGKETFQKRLDYGFEKERFQVHNEPSFLISRLYHYAGRPDLSSLQVRKWMAKWDGGNCPGNDDSGAMSSWYLFSLAGLFPVAGQDVYLLTGPRYERIEIRPVGGSGKPLVITGRNAGSANPYIQRATLNGRPLERSWLRHDDLLRGGELAFEMGPELSDWARSSELPPSF